MNSESVVGSSKSAFLDTNALVSLFVFREVCNAAGISLDAVADWSGLKVALEAKNQFTAGLNSTDAGIVSVGLTYFQKLSNNANSYQYFSSTVCRSEMHHVLLESRGLESLIRQKVPHGLRVKRPQILYRRALETNDYVELQNDMDGFFESLRFDYGIEIVEVELTSTGTAVTVDDVWSTAREVWSRVLIEVMDSYIYAAAIEIEADAFLTSDSSLYEALTQLSNPGDEWDPLVISLKESLGKPTGTRLPQPVRPRDPLPS